MTQEAPNAQSALIRLSKKDWLRIILQAGMLILGNFVCANLTLAVSNVTYTYGEREILEAALLASMTITFVLFLSNAMLSKRIEHIEKKLEISGNQN